MKTAIATLLGALGGAAFGATIAWTCSKPLESSAAAVRAPDRQLTFEAPGSPSLLAREAERPRVEPDRTAALGELERGLHEQIDGLRRELARRSDELAKRDEELVAVSGELAFARENPNEDFFRRFKAMEMTAGLTDEEKTNVFVYVVKPIWELPEPEQVRPIADAIGRYKAAKEKWDWEWAEDPAGPQGDPSHPDAQRLTDEFEAIRLRWVVELGAALGDQDRACLIVR